jgi:NAD(P) transhydrogenase
VNGADFDVLVLGSGPGGQRAAIAAAELGRRTAVMEGRDVVGGVCTNTGTIPSKTLREAVLYLTGMTVRELFGQSLRGKEDITAQDLLSRTQQAIEREIEMVRSQLYRNGVSLLQGVARFVDPHTVTVANELSGERRYTADRIVIATGTRPAHPDNVEFDGRRVLDSEGILTLEDIPLSLVVVGAGVIGIEYAAAFAALGSRVTIVEQRDRMLEFCDTEIVDALRFHLRGLSVTFRFNEKVAAVHTGDKGTVTTLASGKRIPADAVMYSAGRRGATQELGLEAAGLEADPRGQLEVDENYRTAVPHIYAVGDVIGFPVLAATSMEQGRLAAHHACDEPADPQVTLSPIGIYTIPEISFCGQTEEQLTTASVSYEVGISRFRELARGQIMNDAHGMLKLLVSAQTRQLLGVHVFGPQATELIHLGQAIMTCSGTVDQLVNTVFNYPTLSEAYRVAALDAVNKLRAHERFDS